MAEIQFDVDKFRLDFPAFADETKYPDETLQGYFDVARCFISPVDYGYLHGDCRERALYLMTAHLTQLGYQAASGGGGGAGIATSATIGAVSVSSMAPPVKTAFQYWLFTTPYGAQLAALLGIKGVGGLYVGGRPELSAFRKVGGAF